MVDEKDNPSLILEEECSSKYFLAGLWLLLVGLCVGYLFGDVLMTGVREGTFKHANGMDIFVPYCQYLHGLFVFRDYSFCLFYLPFISFWKVLPAVMSTHVWACTSSA